MVLYEWHVLSASQIFNFASFPNQYTRHIADNTWHIIFVVLDYVFGACSGLASFHVQLEYGQSGFLSSYILMGSVAISRLGLWMFHLSVLQQMQARNNLNYLKLFNLFDVQLLMSLMNHQSSFLFNHLGLIFLFNFSNRILFLNPIV